MFIPPLLKSIHSPAQLRQLSPTQLPLLALEVREFLLHSVGKSGGHLASGLGTVELTIALHYIFNTPDDRLIWDVGHQTYPHKMLTGRLEELVNIRKKDGLSGFPKREESPYDAFGTGHSSTSISAALGMALAVKNYYPHRKHIAVIGDGAMTAGMAFEALNHAGDSGANLLVILNDNDMSISPNVGALSNYLARILSSHFYSSVRDNSKKVLAPLPPFRELAKRAEEHVKGMVLRPSTLFEEMGFNYIGPIDGHNLDALLTTLHNLKHLSQPQFLHVVTKKGKGYAPAETDPTHYHGVSSFDVQTGYTTCQNKKQLTYTDVFSHWICNMAQQDDKLVAITPAMREGSGLTAYAQQFPDRYFDVGIAEQHSLTFAAGMACEGLKPVVAIYSTFLQRAYDQLIHDIAIQNLDVTLAIDRAGIVGADGATHSGSFDLSYLRCIPNLIIMAPANEEECQQMLYTAYMYPGPAAVRYPRGSGSGVELTSTLQTLTIGTGVIHYDNSNAVHNLPKILLLSFGNLLSIATQAAKALSCYRVMVINMRFIKPLDTQLLANHALDTDLFVTIEDNCIAGGAGSAVNEYLAAYTTPGIINMGIPDEFPKQGTQTEVLSSYALSAKGIIQRIQDYFTHLNHTHTG